MDDALRGNCIVSEPLWVGAQNKPVTATTDCGIFSFVWGCSCWVLRAPILIGSLTS